MRGIAIGTGWMRRQLIVAACVCVGALALGAGLAQAKVVHLNGQAYGITYPPGHGATVTPGDVPSPFAPTIGSPTQPPLLYGNGPLMLTPKLYLIFWGPSGSFASSYENPIIQWAKDLAADGSTNLDEYSVVRQYKNAASKPLTGKVIFGAAVNDTRSYPTRTSACVGDANPCIMDSQLQAEIKHEISAEGWPLDPASAPEAHYIVLTPAGVDGCIDSLRADCTFEGGYCGYHAETTSGSNVAVYTDTPYVPGCDSGQAPAGVGGNADTDGSLDTLIHEVAEAATDPDDASGYVDQDGYEIGDKCDGQSISLSRSQIYGTPLGGTLSAFTAFNQLINGHSYYTQTQWSNASTKTPSSPAVNGCAQRFGPSPSFTAPSTITTGTAATFNGSGSYDLASPITTYIWNFGDGSPVVTTTSAKPAHIYDSPGTYTVTLTVGDVSGSVNHSRQTLKVKVTGSTLVPSISGFSPSGGPTGTTVTITGSRLASASKVTFNTVAAHISSDTTSQIKAVVPAGATTGKISVTTSGGKATSASNFTVS
jgi:PKD repeat protein